MRIPSHAPLLALIIGSTAAGPLHAQMQAPTHFVTWQAPMDTPTRPVSIPDSAYPAANGSGMVLGGITGVFAGYILGGAFGAVFWNSDNSDDWSQFEAAVLGGAIISSATIPLGVHYGNHGRGRLLESLLPSLAIGALGTAVVVGSDNPTPLLLMPIAQMIASAWFESRSMARADPAGASP